MTKQRILIIGTYPIHPAMHGGQKRTSAIIAKYRELGHEVKYVSICTPGNYPRYSASDLRVNDDAMRKTHKLPSPTFTELITCREAAKDARIVKKFKSIASAFNPTIVQYEQGYGYEFTRSITEGSGVDDVSIIFSSHNVEWEMKRDIALSEGCTEEEIEEYVAAVRDLEIGLIERSSHTIVVSEADATMYTKAASSSKKFTVAHNGINPLQPSGHAEEYWRELYDKEGATKVAVFVASAHPPNLHGFRTLVDGIGFLPFSYRIVIAGGVADILKQMVKKTSDIQLATLRNRVILAGRLSEEKLQGLISTADAVILPILEGGGSNLKTAEALVSAKPIVATSHAYRSYEEYKELPNTYIADDSAGFQQAILKAFDSPYRQRNDEQIRLVSKVLWEQCLQPLEQILVIEE